MRKMSEAIATILTIFIFSSIGFAELVVSIEEVDIGTLKVGDEFVVKVNISGGENVMGYQFTVNFDSSVLKYEKIENADYLPETQNPFSISPQLKPSDNPDLVNEVTFATTAIGANANGDGTLATITFKVVELSETTIELSEDGLKISDPAANQLPATAVDGKISVTIVENKPPTAKIEASKTEVKVGESITFNGDKSTDSDGEITKYVWNFGDGSDPIEKSTPTIEHTFANPGDYNVTLEVFDNGNPALTASSDALEITVDPAELPPVVTEHVEGTEFLSFKVEISEDGESAKAQISVFEEEDGFVAEVGQFVEYQVKFSPLNKYYDGGVYIHTADGEILGPVDTAQSSMRSIFLEEAGQWEHRKISLDPVAGKTITAITVGTTSEAAKSGVFDMAIDNIQVTDGTKQIRSIWDAETGTKTPEIFGTTEGIAGTIDSSIEKDPVTPVEALGKFHSTWGAIKSER